MQFYNSCKTCLSGIPTLDPSTIYCENKLGCGAGDTCNCYDSCNNKKYIKLISEGILLSHQKHKTR